MNSVMTSELTGPLQHPVAAFYDRLDARLDDVNALGLMSMSPGELRGALVARNRARAKEDAL